MLFDEPLNYYRLNKPPTNREKVIGFLILVPVFCLIFGGVLYLFRRYDAYERAEILKNPAYAIGIIVDKDRKRIYIEYSANKEVYTHVEHISRGSYKKYKIGDEILLVYNRLDPPQVMLKKDFSDSELSK
ncbi:hypothetical protein [Emticicia fontis]